jgi:hypothetical protein
VESWSSLVASASVIALLAVLGLRARQGTTGDQRRLASVLLAVAVLMIFVGVAAFLWTLTRPT